MPVSEQEETQHRTITTPHSTIPTATVVSEAALLEAHAAVALEAVEEEVVFKLFHIKTQLFKLRFFYII